MKYLKWAIERAKERSTWIGATALITGLGVSVSPELKEAIISLGIAVAGFVAVVTKDKASA